MAKSEDRVARLAAIRERAAAATPGPWGWRGNLDAKQITLFRLRAWGDVVMDFCRWGFQEAMPQFVTDGIIRKPEWIMGPPHHPWEIVGIDHPDATFIAESRADIDFLLAEVERLAEVAALVERFATETYAGANDELLLLCIGRTGRRLIAEWEALAGDRGAVKGPPSESRAGISVAPCEEGAGDELPTE